MEKTKPSARLTLSQKRMKALLYIKDLLSDVARFTGNSVLDADYVELTDKIDRLIIAESGMEAHSSLSFHKKNFTSL